MMERRGGRRWFWGSSLGLAVGIPLGLALGAPLEVLVGAMIVTPLMLGLTGLLLGTSQWSALRGRIPRAGAWVALTAAGFGVGFTVAIVLVEQGGELITGVPTRMATTGAAGLALSLVVIGLVGGSLLGLAQSIALRAYDGATARWTAGSALGLTAGFLVAFAATTAVGGLVTPQGLVLFLTLSSAVYAVITGRVLDGLAARPSG